jgi:hypothetical protein
MLSFSRNVEKFSLKKENEAMLRHEKEKIHGIVAPKLPEFHRENFLQKKENERWRKQEPEQKRKNSMNIGNIQEM